MVERTLTSKFATAPPRRRRPFSPVYRSHEFQRPLRFAGTGDERSFRPLQEAAEPGQQRGPVQPGGQPAERRVQAVVGGKIAAAAAASAAAATSAAAAISAAAAAVSSTAATATGATASTAATGATTAIVVGRQTQRRRRRRLFVRRGQPTTAAVRGDHTPAAEPRPGNRPVADRTAQTHRVAVREPERGALPGSSGQAQSE